VSYRLHGRYSEPLCVLLELNIFYGTCSSVEIGAKYLFNTCMNPLVKIIV